MNRVATLTRTTALLLFLGLALPTGDAAAQVYPSRPLTMVVPYPAGGPTDAIARILAEGLRVPLGQPVVIENVSGAGASPGNRIPRLTEVTEADPGSVREVAENFIKRHVDHERLRSKKEIERCLNRYVYPHVGELPFMELDRSRIAKLVDKIVDDHGAVQADMVLAIISSVCRWYQARDSKYTSPIVPGMRRTKPTERARTRFLGDKGDDEGDDEIRAVWNAATECGPFGAMVKVLLLTGQRLRKVAHMQHTDISDGVWSIKTEPREKGNPGKLRLPKLVLDIIAAQPRVAGNPYVFVGQRGPVSAFTDGKRELDRKIPNLRPWVLHDLRRTARTLMARIGIPDHIAERTLGHRLQGLMAVYNKYSYTEEKSDALNRLAHLVDTIVNPPPPNVVSIPPGRKKAG